MKNTGLLITLRQEDGDADISTDYLQLILIAGKRQYVLNPGKDILDDADYESFIGTLVDLINEAWSLRNLIELDIKVSDDVIGYIEGKSDDVEKEVNNLILEL